MIKLEIPIIMLPIWQEFSGIIRLEAEKPSTSIIEMSNFNGIDST